ncbi:retrovirus-related pol polyprotein from transposon TNT 1-94, partial [Tanacetum coccineum]
MRVASVNGKKYILVIIDDYSRFTWFKCIRSKDEALDLIIKFLKMIQKVSISYETSIARSPQQNGVVERRNHTLIESTRRMLIYAKAPLFLWVEAVATTCYTQNRSIVRLRHGKTPYELLHDKPSDLSFFHVFGALCYPINESENLCKLQPKADIDSDELTAMASEHSSSGPALHEMTPATISLGLVPNPPPSTPFRPSSRTDWDILFQTMFDELLTPPPSVDYPSSEVVALIHEVVALVPAVSTGSPSSTNVDQDAPSPSHSQTTLETQPPVIPNNVEEDNHDIEIAHMGNDPHFGDPILEDHPLENIIGELARPISTRLQLHEQALFCYYDAFLTAVEPKTYKDALTQACWIEAMQEELNEFEHVKEDEFHDDNTSPPPPPVTPTQQAPHTLSTIKLHILKKDTNGQIKVLPSKTAEEILATKRERKARTTLLMDIPEDHLAKVHKMTNGKEMWEAIKSRFVGNDESKKMQKYILKQHFESFSVSNLEGLHKGYDRFQSLLSQLEIHGACVSTEDANQEFLRSLPISCTNDVNTAYGVSTSSGHNLQKEGSSSYTDELKYFFFANQSSGPQLDHEDLEQVDEFDLEEMDLKWQVVMISIRLKKFYKKTGRRLQSKGNQESRRRDAGNTGYKAKYNGRRPEKQEEPKALVTLNRLRHR